MKEILSGDAISIGFIEKKKNSPGAAGAGGTKKSTQEQSQTDACLDGLTLAANQICLTPQIGQHQLRLGIPLASQFPN